MLCYEMKLGAPETTFREAPETAMWKLEMRGSRPSSADPWPPPLATALGRQIWGRATFGPDEGATLEDLLWMSRLENRLGAMISTEGLRTKGLCRRLLPEGRDQEANR